MSVQDLWYRRGANGDRAQTARHGTGKRWRVRYTDLIEEVQRSESFARRIDAELRDMEIREAVDRLRPALEAYERVVYDRQPAKGA